jgi:hypothetical protein
VLTTQEKPFEVGCLAGETLPVRDFQLNGLPTEAAENIFKAKGVHVKEHQKSLKALINKYNGHPLMLKMISTTIKEVFNGDVAAFNSVPDITVMFASLIKSQYERLSDLEKKIMHCIASCEKHPISLTQLQENLSLEPLELISALESLAGQSLIEKLITQDGTIKTPCFKLQHIVKRYVDAIDNKLQNNK